MKFKFNQNWKSQKAGETLDIPKQLANELAGKGVGEIVGQEGKAKKTTSQVKEVPNETPKSNAKPS